MGLHALCVIQSTYTVFFWSCSCRFGEERLVIQLLLFIKSVFAYEWMEVDKWKRGRERKKCVYIERYWRCKKDRDCVRWKVFVCLVTRYDCIREKSKKKGLASKWLFIERKRERLYGSLFERGCECEEEWESGRVLERLDVSRVTRLGDFLKSFGDKFSLKSSQSLLWLFGVLWKASFFSKNYRCSFWGNFWINLDYFLFLTYGHTGRKCISVGGREREWEREREREGDRRGVCELQI